MSYRSLPGVLCFCLLAGLSGCGRKQPQAAPPQPPVVPISQPVQRQVTDYADFTGRTDAVQAVDVRARVTGYLEKILFREGAEVKAGEVLFEIDPRPYQAQLDQASSQVDLNVASLRLARVTYARDQSVAAQAAGAVTQQQLDQDLAAVEEATARVKASQASTEVYKLNLSFTRVTSPIAGKISRYYLTVGNLVVQDQTLLTTVVSLDPMYAYFDVDEATVLRVRQAINEGKIKKPEAGNIPVFMALQGEEGFPHRGTLNFVNNQFNPTTGSISVRGVFANPLPPDGVRLLSPGMFVRTRLQIGQPHQAVLVIDRAIGSDQGLKFVYVVDSEGKAQYRRVTTGQLEPDGLRVIGPVKRGKDGKILEGLEPNEWVVVGGLQQVRPRMPVKTDKIPMPTIGPVAPAGNAKE